MKFYSPAIRRLLNRWPGQKTFGVYRFLPVFFVLGAALEFSMINWRVGEVNFYNTFKQRQAQQIVQQKLLEELETNKENAL
ncbi:small integral membrane protein 4 [Dendroctonus ponderosae]|uniref:Small integral membrane protein 4 n=1 Tax=Dendroctonus ponderosae TaxID=77166 RepID=A0AAR5P9Z9_DENPD|nr:small integral membrane protein 4 [Dendroctonus ponderosae]